LRAECRANQLSIGVRRRQRSDL